MTAFEDDRRVDAIVNWIAERHVVLLSDFDGTLAELAPTPDSAVVLPEVQRALVAMAGHPGLTLGVVSGRRLADVRQRVGAPLDYVSGLHGLEIEGPSRQFRHPSLDAAQPLIQEIARQARATLAWCPSAVIEDKTYALTCHVRQVDPAEADRVLDSFVGIAQPHLDAGRLRRLTGTAAIELLPAANWDKGRACAWIREDISRHGGSPRPMMYFGDDRTDEYAFGALQPGDLGVGLGDRPHDNLIQFRLDGPASMGRLLTRLADALVNQSI